MNPINWFEIPVTDMHRAKSFYEEILQLQISIHEMDRLLMGWFPFSKNGGGATGTLLKAESYVPSHQGTMVYFSVPEIVDVLNRVEKAGGKVLNPKTSIGQDSFVGHFEDSEGNRVGLHQGAA